MFVLIPDEQSYNKNKTKVITAKINEAVNAEEFPAVTKIFFCISGRTFVKNRVPDKKAITNVFNKRKLPKLMVRQ